VREVCLIARSRGIRTIVDGAHGLGHIPVDVRQLGCDYYGSSGHKWLMGPLGTGFLYVRRELIPELWPLMPSFEQMGRDIRKFEWVGGQSLAGQVAMADALTFQERLGVDRKAARLRYLKRRWAERLARHSRVRLFTDLNPTRSCGIGSFSIEGVEHAAFAEDLLMRHRVLVGGFGKALYDGPPGIRVVPNVFTSAKEVDLFAGAVEAALRTGTA